MAASNEGPTGPDFAAGIALSEAPDEGMIAGHVGEDAVLLSRFGGVFSAVGGGCSHYGGPLAKGLVVGDTVRCPWHHACFSLRTGEALAAPAFDPLPRWQVEVEGGRVFVRASLEGATPAQAIAKVHPARIVIVGGGAAGFAAAEMLRRRGYAGSLVMLSADADPPCDRPNLSKDYLAGSAPEEWIPLKDEAFYRDRGIELALGVEVARIDVAGGAVVTLAGESIPYDALLLATGSEPIWLPTPGFDQDFVHTLRSLADSRAIIAAAKTARTAVVIGASFIGLEVAASLRERGLEVHVVAPDAVPLERVMGRELGAAIQALHEKHGVVFHLGRTGVALDGHSLRLSGGDVIETELVVQGVGVRPRTALAEAAGLTVDKGVVVDALFQTSAAGIFAAGDIARYPDPRGGATLRIEHWVAAERQGQAAALAMLGEGKPFTAPPFFWSVHYDLTIRYVGHAQAFDRVEIDGSLAGGHATVRYFQGDKVMAAASVGRDKENLEIAAAMETGRDA